MKTFTPFKTQKNRANGLFGGDPLGAIQAVKKVDMAKAKTIIRRNRKAFKAAQREKVRQKAKLQRVKAWWKRRSTWRSLRMGDRVGKLNPQLIRAMGGWVEFPDGSQEWVNTEEFK